MTNTKILLVEDESIVAKDIQSMLRDLGYGVTEVVASGEEAINRAEDQLHGDIRLDRRKGTSFRIKFEVKQ